jgi:hypothetical protein
MTDVVKLNLERVLKLEVHARFVRLEIRWKNTSSSALEMSGAQRAASGPQVLSF